MNIDWSKAPEDATHAGTTTRLQIPVFYKDIREAKYSYWYADGDGWREDVTGNPACAPLIERPKKQEAWNGVCIPPIDLECKVVEAPALWEHSGMSDWIGRNVKVKSTFINNIGQQIASVESDNSECACFIVECLRPIKTAEQLADEERKSQLEFMHKIYMEGASEHKGGLAALYDAGYKLAK